MNNDLVIGAVTNYAYEQIEPWLVSLKKTGYEGRIALIAYNMSKETADKLIDKGVHIFAFQQDDKGDYTYPAIDNFSIMVERFAHLWHFISNTVDELRFVITTDVKDVIFQKNPSEWLEKNLFTKIHQIVVGSENFRYKDEPWSKNNMNNSFGPMLFNKVKDNAINCAGVIAGRREEFEDLCLNIFLACRGSVPHVPGGGGPDQAALNILLSLEPFNSTTLFTNTDSDWVCHMGTSIHAIKSGHGEIGQQYLRNPDLLNTFKEAMIGDDPVIKDDLVCNSQGTPYAIVHQYDRVTELKDKLDKLYRE